MELKVLTPNASELAKHDPESFSMIRRVGFGASDSSVLLGVNPFPDNTIPKLIEQKQSNFVTPQELAIGQLVNVRKGIDLEPIILRKFQEKYSITDKMIHKPEAMYRIGDTPLTVNYDGILSRPPFKIPVEVKFVSMYGGKYWDTTKAIGDELVMDGDLPNLGVEVNAIYLTERAKEAGIPIYYYTQLQQQMLGLGAPFGYLVGLFDKEWEIKVFLVMADEQVQQQLIKEAENQWEKVVSSQ